MASIRRTLSPYNDRSYQNGGTPFSLHSPPHKLSSNGKNLSLLSTFNVVLRQFLAGVKHSKKGPNTWRKSFYRCLFVFLLGFLLGMAPFGDLDDTRNRDFSFEVKLAPINVKEHVKQSVEGVVVARPEDFTLDTVELDVENRSNVKDRFDYSPRKQLIVVTPTYNRALQAFYLNRLAQVLRLVPPPLIWIVMEMNAASEETANMLRNAGVMYRHLVCMKNSTGVKDRGVHQRNTALEHIERHKLDGIVYFADDDNMYSLELFESMRQIRMSRLRKDISSNAYYENFSGAVKVLPCLQRLCYAFMCEFRFGTWPVAMLAQSKNKAILEGPVCNGSQVIGWHTNEKSKVLRRFHVDMSGFAFNSTILWDPKRWKRPTSDPIRQLDSVKEGFQETTFIEQVVEDESQMEAIPRGCIKTMNWHLHLEAHELFYPRGWLLKKNLDVVLPIK
ncbi:hypothetical protein RJ639_035569 [Escallonia herrerae]|uniref:Glycosyltransferases n=1 Tax=Escallonia herrerae TaxID=1293975 RepID=A0AA88WQN2_9ASTE|nr:hypothetical protein RJ639_035569 [Escallonia herrerae]